MGRVLHRAVFALLLLQCGSLLGNEHQVSHLEYSYEAQVIAASALRNDVYSRMDLQGKFTVQCRNDNTAIMKFTELKSSAYTGEEEQFTADGSFVDISEESYLYKPFVIHYQGHKVESISHLPDEPIWSVNIKRAIGSIFQFDFDTYSTEGATFSEFNIYGNCTLKYEKAEPSDKIINKIIDECENGFETNWNNLLSTPVTPDNFNVPAVDIVRRYTLQENSHIFKRIESEAVVLYKTMPIDQRAQYVNQTQVFVLLSNSNAEHVIDTSELTVKENVKFESVDEQLSSEFNGTQLMETLLEHYGNFQERFTSDHIPNYNVFANDTIDQMFSVLSHMSKGQLDFTTLLLYITDDIQAGAIFMSLIPYIGTEQSVKFITDMVDSDALNDLIAIKILATFPTYVNNPTNSLLKELEVLLKLDKVDNKHVRHTGILSFASAVADAYNRDGCSKALFKKYVKKFTKLYTDATNYEERMIYLLALSNLGIGLNSDFILPIITNEEERPQLRALGTYAFKREITSEPDEVFTTMWPVAKNHSEPFEVRVAALDLIMSSEISKKQYYIILKYFSKYPSEREEQHLYQYFYTTIMSMQDYSKYSTHLSDLTISTFKKIEIPKSFKTLGTGNYRLSYTDATGSFGRYYEAKIVANPNTNLVHTLQLTENRFAFSLNLATCSIYLKFEGVPEVILERLMLLSRENSDTAIPKLVELISKHNFKLKEFADLHIDLVIFADNRAIFAMHMNNHDLENFFEIGMIGDLLKQFQSRQTISFPIMYHSVVVSDLGTSIKIKNEVTQYYYQNITNLEKIFDDEDGTDYALNLRFYEEQYINTYYEDVIVNRTIGTYDLRYNEYILNFPFVFNGTGSYIEWINSNINLEASVKVTAGTIIEDETEITGYDFTETAEDDQKELQDQVSGMNLTLKASASGSFSVSIFDLLSMYGSKHYSESKWALLFLHAVDYLTYVPPYTAMNVEVKTNPMEQKSKSHLAFDITGDSFKENTDPFDGFKLGASIEYISTNLSDGSDFFKINASAFYVCTPQSESDHKLSRNSGVELFIQDVEESFKVCFYQNISYPGRRTDKYSLDPVQPAEGKIVVAFGSDCSPQEYLVEFTGLALISDKQKQYIQTMPEYDICKKQSAGLKYTPPTKECVEVSHIMSTYRQYDMEMKWDLSQYIPQNLEANISQHQDLIEYEGEFINGSRKFTKLYDLENPESELHGSCKYCTEMFLTDANALAYYDEETAFGFSSDCFITPNNIKTFTDVEITKYEEKIGENLVGFVECINATRSGLVFSKIGDKHLAFKFWDGDNILAATRSNDKLHVLLNGEVVEENKVDDEVLSIYFFDMDVIYVITPLLDIYYNTEYIILKTFSNYNNYLCGLCSNDH